MPNEQRLHVLAQRLLEGTRNKTLKWAAAGPERFQLSLPNGAIVVDKLGSYPSMSVYDDEGNFVEDLTEGRSSKPWDDVLRGLWDAARDSALDIDKVLDSILRDVESASQDADDDIPSK